MSGFVAEGKLCSLSGKSACTSGRRSSTPRHHSRRAWYPAHDKIDNTCDIKVKGDKMQEGW